MSLKYEPASELQADAAARQPAKCSCCILNPVIAYQIHSLHIKSGCCILNPSKPRGSRLTGQLATDSKGVDRKDSDSDDSEDDKTRGDTQSL